MQMCILRIRTIATNWAEGVTAKSAALRHDSVYHFSHLSIEIGRAAPATGNAAQSLDTEGHRRDKQTRAGGEWDKQSGSQTVRQSHGATFWYLNEVSISTDFTQFSILSNSFWVVACDLRRNSCESCKSLITFEATSFSNMHYLIHLLLSHSHCFVAHFLPLLPLIRISFANL